MGMALEPFTDPPLFPLPYLRERMKAVGYAIHYLKIVASELSA